MKYLMGLCAFGLALPAWADDVTLKNGATFSGIVREDGDRIVVELDFGTMSFKKVDVRSIQKAVDPLKEFEGKLKVATDAKSLYELGLWAREKGLGTRATELLRKVITLDPDHEGARKLLGYEKVQGKWMTSDEAMVARGMVRQNGDWVPRESVEKAQQDDKQIKLELDRLAAEARLAVLQHEVEILQIEAAKEKVGPLYGPVYGSPLGNYYGVFYPRWVWGTSAPWFSDPPPRRTRPDPPTKTKSDQKP